MPSTKRSFERKIEALRCHKSQLDPGAPATSYASETAELWIVPVSRDAMTTTGSPRRLDHANGPSGANSWPTWAPDGSFFAFASNRAGPATSWDVYVAAFDTMTGLDSPAVPLKHASDPGRNEHIPAWGP